MGLLPLDLVQKRVEARRAESQVALFHDLLHLAEAFLKTYVAAIVAGVPNESDRHRYRLCHKLVRAAGIGEWDEVLADVSTGPASQHLMPGASAIQQELSQRCGPGSWVYDATALLHACLKEIAPDAEPLPTRAEGRRWFNVLVQFRNKTKGHGAITNDIVAKILGDLERSIRLYIDNSVVPRLQWVFVKRNLSGKYHVAGLSAGSSAFDKLKGDRSTSLLDGVYIDLGGHCRVELIETSVDLTEFYYPNGQFRPSSRGSEWLSYITGALKNTDGTPYLAPATVLPPSGTEGAHTLDVIGRCFANLPPDPSEYVSRDELEADLTRVLADDRHPVVTLVGRGGIGKTSLALRVLHQLAHSEDVRFTGIVWLSARDIDLLPQGPKLVKPFVLTTKGIAHEVASLFQPIGWDQKKFDAEKYLSEALGKSQEGPLLIVFDNFETVHQPIDVFNWLDTYVRSPNKILITTRHRDFRGDYAVEVGGMTEAQCGRLVRTTAAYLRMRAAITAEFCRDVYRESEGHPYVVKVLVGEAVEGRLVQKVERIVAGRDDLLDALFERTYARLSPAGKRVFLTLCNWRSLVAQLALDAAFLRPTQAERIDTWATLEELRRVSFIDEHVSPKDRARFVSVPVVGSVFGRRKLSVSPDRIEVESATRFLHRFGAMQPSDVQHGIEPRIHRFLGSLSEELDRANLDLTAEKPVLELIAHSHPATWLTIADLWRESGHLDAPKEVRLALERYIEMAPPNGEQRLAWESIAAIERQQNNWFGFVNAQVHIAELQDANIATISAAVNTVNIVRKYLESDAEALLSIDRRLTAVMEPKISTGDATDCSRLAWVLVHSGKNERALEIIDCGLRLDPSNEYCRKLKATVWERIAENEKASGNRVGFLNATVKMVEVPGTDMAPISSAANTFNQIASDPDIVRDPDFDPDVRRSLAQRLCTLMEPKIAEGDAIDCSRLGWLLVHAGRTERVFGIVERGLKMDPNNSYCLRLKAKFAADTRGSLA